MRKSNIELLRIISMILIVMAHCDDIFGLANLYSSGLGANKLITDWLNAGGQIGVGCFLLISGYFMVDQTITVKKVLRLAGEVWFYTIGIWIVWAIYIFITTGFEKDIVLEGIYAFFPITFSHYWFVTAYMILMVFVPFLNKVIWAMSKDEYQKLLACMMIVFVIIQGGIPGALVGMTGSIIPVFIYYFLAGYLKRFKAESKGGVKRHLAIALLLYAVLILSFYLLTFVGVKFNSSTVMGARYFYRELNSPVVVPICIELFITMSEMKMRSSAIINEIASCTFGVYLIHENRLLNVYLHKIFPIYKETRSLYVFVYSIIAVIGIYSICSVVDYARKKTVERRWILFLDRYVE